MTRKLTDTSITSVRWDKRIGKMLKDIAEHEGRSVNNVVCHYLEHDVSRLVETLYRKRLRREPPPD
jgi:predicted HicB family RNase H-like nuclease